MNGTAKSPRRPPEAARERMLDAAEEVVIRDGIGCLTLDAVAREAKLSKSGLLHHFPSKDILIRALVERVVDGWRDHLDKAFAAQQPGPGRVPRASLATCLSSTKAWTESLRRRGVVMVAALVHDSRHVAPLREVHRSVFDRIAVDGLPPGVGEAVQLAVDGMWFDWIFGLTEMTPQKLGAVRAALGRLVQAGIDLAERSGVRGQHGRRAAAGTNRSRRSKPATPARTRSTRKGAQRT